MHSPPGKVGSVTWVHVSIAFTDMNIHNRDMFLGQPEQLSLTTSTAKVEEGSKLWQQCGEADTHLSGPEKRRNRVLGDDSTSLSSFEAPSFHIFSLLTVE